MFRFISLLSIIISALSLLAEIRGTWHGALSLQGKDLPLVFNVDESSMDSPLQGAKGIPCEITASDDSLTVFCDAIGMRFAGVLKNGRIEGKFTQNGFDFPLTLVEGDYVAPRPQTPKPPYPYIKEDVAVVNPADSALLSGTLTLPLSAKLRGYTKIPVVVIISGSGLQDRDGNMFGHHPYEVIAHHLAVNGIASLRCDDRGFGKSTGDVAEATSETFAADAAAQIAYLRSAGFEKVGVIGHSEGGMIAFMLGAQGLPDFIVSLAGSAVSGDKILLDQNEKVLKALGLSDARLSDYIAGLSMLIEYMKAHPQMREWPDELSATSGLSNLTAEMLDNYDALAKMWNPWMDFFVKFDPAESIRATRCPVFAANGSLDMQVSPQLNLKVISDNLPSDPRNLIKEYPSLNHLFQTARSGHPSEYSTITETISPTLLGDLVDWISSLQ